MEYRAASHFSGGHSDDVDHVSWNPTHPELFCTSSQKDRRIVFWDARRKGLDASRSLGTDDLPQESRHVQQIQLKVSPVQTNYAPDGKSLLYTSAGHQVFFLTYGKDSESSKDTWQISDKDGVSEIEPSFLKVFVSYDVTIRQLLRRLPCSTMLEMGSS